MTDSELQEIYQTGKNTSHEHALRCVFEAGVNSARQAPQSALVEQIKADVAALPRRKPRKKAVKKAVKRKAAAKK